MITSGIRDAGNGWAETTCELGMTAEDQREGTCMMRRAGVPEGGENSRGAALVTLGQALSIRPRMSEHEAMPHTPLKTGIYGDYFKIWYGYQRSYLF
jgi:hypothetical protein